MPINCPRCSGNLHFRLVPLEQGGERFLAMCHECRLFVDFPSAVLRACGCSDCVSLN